MISSLDKEYINTFKVLSGKKCLSKTQKELITWISSNYKIDLINIIFDSVKIRKKKEPRIILITKSDREKDIIINHEYKNGVYNCWDTEVLNNIKEYILKNYASLLIGEKDRTFIIVSSFEQPYCAQILEKDSIGIKKTIYDEIYNENLWTVEIFFSRIIIFYYQTSQIPSNKNELEKIIKEKVLHYINKHDIFDILTEKNIIVEFDSKENFDTNYQGNWFFYTR